MSEGWDQEFWLGSVGNPGRTPSSNLQMKNSVVSSPRRHAAKTDKIWRKGDASKSGPVGAERAGMKQSGKLIKDEASVRIQLPFKTSYRVNAANPDG